MRIPLFGLPTIRWPGIETSTEHHDDIGTGPPWPGGLNPKQCDQLIEQCSGLIRSLYLAGYATTAVRFEHQGDALDIELPSRRAGGYLAAGPASLDALRGQNDPPFIAVEVSPLPLFGPACRLPLAIPLSLTTQGETHHIVDGGQTRWIAVQCTGTSYKSSKVDLRGPLLAACASIAADVDAHWGPPPATGSPSGLGFLFDQGRWNYPPAEPSLPRGAGPSVNAAWQPFIAHYVDDAANRGEWLDDECATVDYPKGWFDNNRLGLRMKNIKASPSALEQAYRSRLVESLGELPPACVDLADSMRDLSASDAVLAHVEHGALDPFLDIQLRDDVAVQPEWTEPCLTGLHAANDGQTTNMLLINQAGSHLEGYLMRRVVTQPTAPYHDIQVRAFSVDLRQAGGTIREYEGDVWLIDDSGGPNDNSTIPISELDPATADTGTITTDTAGGSLAVIVDFPGGPQIERFGRIGDTPHVSNQFLASTGASRLTRRRLHESRRFTLHPVELALADQIIERITTGTVDWYDDWVGTAVEQLQIYSAMENDVIALLDEEWQPGSSTSKVGDIGLAYGRYIRWVLQGQSVDGGVNTMQILIKMLNQTSAQDAAIATMLGIVLADPDGQMFYYQWKLTDVESGGAFYWVGGSAVGAGVLHIRRVDADGAPMPGEDPFERPIVLGSGLFGVGKPGLEYGLGDLEGDKRVNEGWLSFDFPIDRDLEPILVGSEMSFTQIKGGIGPIDSRTGIAVQLTPSDGSIGMSSTVSADFFTFATLSSTRPDQVKDTQDKWRDGAEMYKEWRRVGHKIYKSKELFKKIGLGVTVMITNGWIQANSTVPAPPDRHMVTPSTLGTAAAASAMFDTDNHHVTAEFLLTLRRFLAGYLPLLVAPLTEIRADGHASHSGGAQHNLDLSERRAVSMIEAVRNILGPQLGVPAADIVAIGHGETYAGGGPDADRPQDRRTDLTLGGVVTLRL